MSDIDVLQYFSQFIEKETGIVYAEFNRFQLQARLEEVAKSLSCPTVKDVYNELSRGMSEPRRQLLLDISTNNETSFFRDKAVFDVIEQSILPSLSNGIQPLNIWSAASSYGQEAYSLSIQLSELETKGKAVPARIHATDISERVLSRAKTGRYTQLEVQRGLSAQTMMTYFRTDGEGWWKIRDKERSRVTFAKQNLKAAFDHLGQFDLILCRNVLIYQSVDGKKEIVSRLTQQLKPGGYLVLGSGESLLGLSSSYESRKLNGIIVYQKIANNSKKTA